MFETFLIWGALVVLVAVLLFIAQKWYARKFIEEFHPHKDSAKEELLKPGDERRGKLMRPHPAPSDHLHEKVKKQKLIRGG
jgi:hypothetical protein